MRTVVCLFALAALTMADDSDLQKILRDSNNKFTAQMFSEVVKANAGKNVVLSAFSVLPPLGLLSLASVGESHDELLDALSLPNDNVTKAVFADLNRGLRSVEGIELKTASKIYIAKGLELNDKFAQESRDVFGSEVQNVDFTQSAAAAGKINKLVEDQTNNRIQNLVDKESLDSSTQSVLVNAIYFKGTWQDQFDDAATVDRDFHVSNEKTIKVPTMRGKKYVRYGEIPELDSKVIEIPYEGKEASMLIVLPNKIDGITTLEEKLKDPKVLQSAEEKMEETKVSIYLPKFKIETTTNLKEVLTNMNVKKLFTPSARLDNLIKNNKNLFISSALQKAFIEVTEAGTEAAAANVFYAVGISLAELTQKVPEFNVDRPFYFDVRTNGQSLFNGVCVQP